MLPLLLAVLMRSPWEDKIGDRSFIGAASLRIQYYGRIGDDDPNAPSFHYGGSGFKAMFSGTSLAMLFEEDDWGAGNWIGIRIDGSPEIRLYLEPKSDALYQIAVGLEPKEHDLEVYRRSDAVDGWSRFKGFVLDQGAKLSWPTRRPRKRIEFFGDSVTSGAHAEAVGYEARNDDEIATFNEKSPLVNAYWSYASIAARELGAEAHVNGIGGLALNDENGWWGGQTLKGLGTTFDKLSPIPGRMTPWNFQKWTPHVVVIAIGQNDGRFMKADRRTDRDKWKATYRSLLNKLRDHYPKARFILTTTILEHDLEWDKLLEEVAFEYRRDCRTDQVRTYRYKRAGVGTPGHLRLKENQEMARELVAHIRSLGNIWKNP